MSIVIMKLQCELWHGIRQAAAFAVPFCGGQLATVAAGLD